LHQRFGLSMAAKVNALRLTSRARSTIVLPHCLPQPPPLPLPHQRHSHAKATATIACQTGLFVKLRRLAVNLSLAFGSYGLGLSGNLVFKHATKRKVQ
jgi:hypothetical protein